MDYSCLLCPWLVAKCAGEKKRHRESQTKSSPIVRNSDVACVKTAVEAHRVDCDGFAGSGEVGLAADGDGGTEAEGLGAAGGGLGISTHQLFPKILVNNFFPAPLCHLS